MNTYGLRSINVGTFNLKWHSNYSYPHQMRNALVTYFKIHNLTLNIFGYLHQFAKITGNIRIVSGLAICAVTLAVGERNAKQGAIIGHWYDEALWTGIAQIARGILEAYVPYGWAVNASLDVIGTFVNLTKEVANASTCRGCMAYRSHEPYPDPKYPLPFSLLNIV